MSVRGDNANFTDFLRAAAREPFFWLAVTFLVAALVTEYGS
jgi:hypothetical protein